METIKLKTNIKCGGCVATVTPFLNDSIGAGNWEVDTQTPEKVLTVQVDGVSAETVKAVVQQAGYKAEILP